MEKRVTVKQAIKRGQKMVSFPSMSIMILGFIFSLLLFNTDIHKAIPIIAFLSSLIILPWLYWSFAIVQWRIWAFSNVRNVHELKRQAIEGKLIWPDDSIFNKTEIRNSRQQRILDQLELKFKQHDIPEPIHDDGKLPNELIIYNSKSSKNLQFAGASLFIIFGLYIILTNEPVSGMIIFGAGVYFFFETNKIQLVEPQIIINSKGIRVANFKFIPWSKISYIRLELRGSGKHAKWNLVYKKKRGMEYQQESLLENLECTNEELDDYIKIYQQKNRQKNAK
ncbi:MAG: hypothetical protein AB8H03_00760 [Saprospiraceae bacterium]